MIKVYSKKLGKYIYIDVKDKSLPIENYQCVGCSNSSYGG